MVYFRAMEKGDKGAIRWRRFAVGPAAFCDGAIAILEHCGYMHCGKEELRKASG